MAWDGSPSYVRLGADELAVRVEQALTLLGEERCTVCPRLCKVGRLLDHKGLCAIGRQAAVASYFPHFGEENCLRGHNGSGTIFFSGCSSRPVAQLRWTPSSDMGGDGSWRRTGPTGTGAGTWTCRLKVDAHTPTGRTCGWWSRRR